MSYVAYVTKLKNVRKHPNADRLQLGDCFGNTVCVGLDAYEGQLGIYFPVDGQLSVEFTEHNNLVRKKDENGNNIGGYMDPDKRNVTAVKLRGEKSDGLFLELTCVEYTGVKLSTLKEGDNFTALNGHDICQKYIPRGRRRNPQGGNRTRKKVENVAPLFVEHADTEQLAYNLEAFKPGDLVEITLKMHGTSQRTGYLPVLKGYKRSLLDKLFKREGTPIYNWDYISGTRRVVLNDFEGGFYGSNKFREQHHKFFEGKLHKGEEVYYEVVGYTDDGAPIMGTSENKKLNDKEFIKQYGDTTTFTYGCEVPNSDIYVYRMTMTNEDGDIVEYTPDFMRYRCEQMGVKTVPVFWSDFIPQNPGSADDDTITAGEWIKNVAEQYYDGADPVGKTHIREGVVLRIINRPKFCAYKHKNFNFKCLSGIIAEATANAETAVSEDILSEM